MPDKVKTKFKFTKDDLYARVINALNQQPGQAQGNTAQPNLLQGLLAKSKMATTKANQ